jgi:hypothetical protein
VSFIKKKIQALIIGWVASMAFALVGRILKSLFSQNSQKYKPSQPPQDPPIKIYSQNPTTKVEPIWSPPQTKIQDALYKGMAKSEVEKNLGSPLRTETNSLGQEKWVYKDQEIVFGQNRVESWQDII